MFRKGSMDENSFLQTGHNVRKKVWIGLCTPRREFPMRRVAPCHGVRTARMIPTAQAGWQSWYVSAPRATRKTQTDRRQVRKIYSDCWVACLTVKTAEGKHCRTSLTALSRVGHEIETELGSRQLHQQRVPSNTSQNFAPIDCHTGHLET